MRISKASYGVVCCMTLGIANAYALPSEACFQSKADYDTYMKYESPTATGESTTIVWTDEYGVRREKRSYPGGPPKWKEIAVKYTEELLGNGKVRLNASGSTTPSGQVAYLWHDNGKGYRLPKAILEDTLGKPGETTSINLTIEDPVCEITKQEVITLKLK